MAGWWNEVVWIVDDEESLMSPCDNCDAPATHIISNNSFYLSDINFCCFCLGEINYQPNEPILICVNEVV